MTSRPLRRPTSGRTSARNFWLASRSGEMSRRSTLPVVEPLGDLVPVVLVGAVDRDGPHAHALGGLDLVAHEGEQGRDEQGGPGAPVAQHAGGDEVDGALAPARALHEQHPLASPDQAADDVELVGPEVAGRDRR